MEEVDTILDNAEPQSIATSLEVEQLDRNLFRSKTLWLPKRARGVFGGQVISQAVVAASNCVNPEYGLHSLHCYFLLSASPSIPVLYYVERLREGKTYTTRSVKAVQNGALVFSMTCSFQKEEIGQPVHQRTMPQGIPSPDACKLAEEVLEEQLQRDLSEKIKALIRENVIERRKSPIAIKDTPVFKTADGILTQGFWMRAKSVPKYEIPFQKCILSYMSDLRFLGIAPTTLGLRRSKAFPNNLGMMSTLDHTRNGITGFRSAVELGRALIDVQQAATHTGTRNASSANRRQHTSYKHLNHTYFNLIPPAVLLVLFALSLSRVPYKSFLASTPSELSSPQFPRRRRRERMFVAALTAAAFVANIAPVLSASSLISRDTASDPSSFSSQSFDYIVVGERTGSEPRVGGGTAGLTVASRLAASARVGIIEAGQYFPDDPLIDVPKNFGQNNGNPKYDWRFNTTPQAMLNGRVVPHPRGKVVGGSTALNYLVFNRGSKTEYDSWSEIGNDGWSWDQLTPSFKAVSNYTAITANTTFPNADDASSANSQQQNYLGTDGPIHASYNTYATDLQQPYVLAMNAMGISTNSAPQSGNTTGIYNSPTAVDRTTGKRSYAASFYLKNLNNPNFVLLPGAQATKIEFSPDKRDGNLVATGVTYSVNGASYTVKASKEVILSAGVFQSPHLLELSGIGNSTLLKQFGITPLVDLPSVGENLQDHAMSTQMWQVNPGVVTWDQLRINRTFALAASQQYNTTHDGVLASTINAVTFTSFQKTAENETVYQEMITGLDQWINSTGLTSLQKKQYEIQKRWINESSVPGMEFVMIPSGGLTRTRPENDTSYITVAAILQHPFSRGSVTPRLSYKGYNS
ncbi:hypothetical protein FRC17_011303 [Serendipita sp. 399]|nr:hypothetical protein FRC17_011303 [Serendipita sp. 399]